MIPTLEFFAQQILPLGYSYGFDICFSVISCSLGCYLWEWFEDWVIVVSLKNDLFNSVSHLGVQKTYFKHSSQRFWLCEFGLQMYEDCLCLNIVRGYHIPLHTRWMRRQACFLIGPLVCQVYFSFPLYGRSIPPRS